MIKILFLFLDYQISNFLFACEMNNPDLKYDINPFVCFGEHNRSGLLESEGDISTALFMCCFIKLKEFTTKPHRKAKSAHNGDRNKSEAKRHRQIECKQLSRPNG